MDYKEVFWKVEGGACLYQEDAADLSKWWEAK